MLATTCATTVERVKRKGSELRPSIAAQGDLNTI